MFIYVIYSNKILIIQVNIVGLGGLTKTSKCVIVV